MTREEMREKVARELLFADTPSARDAYKRSVWEYSFTEETRLEWRTMADAAIAIIRGETLKEAARVARGADKYSTMATNEAIVRTMVSDEILALKDKP